MMVYAINYQLVEWALDTCLETDSLQVYYLYRDPKGENLASTNNTYEEQLSCMEDRIKQLESELGTLTKTRKVLLHFFVTFKNEAHTYTHFNFYTHSTLILGWRILIFFSLALFLIQQIQQNKNLCLNCLDHKARIPGQIYLD